MLSNKFDNLRNFMILTGNINNYTPLKFKRFSNSAEELKACLDYQFSKLPSDAKIGENGVLMLSENKYNIDHHYQTSNDYDRNDLKITLKVFLEQFNFKHVLDAVSAVLHHLETQTIEQLIIAFPPKEDDDGSVKWFNDVFELWNEAEKQLVGSGKVLSMGVADFSLDDITRLYKEANVKPSVLHFNIEGCCVVPPDLQQFATENDIQLLTHNDPYPFPLTNVFENFCSVTEPSPICVSKPIWASRYTVWVRRRSLMAGKGFIVQFENSES